MRAMNRLVRLAVTGAALIGFWEGSSKADSSTAGSPSPGVSPAGVAPVGSQVTPPPSPSPLMAVQGSCPSPAMITSAVAALIPRGGVGLLPPSGKVEVADLGDHYRVDVLARGVPRTRLFQDDGRDCELRARFTAVFVVLTLLPPGFLVDVQPKAPPPPEPAPAPRPVAVSPPAKFRLELSAMVDVAPAVFEAPRMIGSGGELRFAWRLGAVSAVFGIALEPRVGFTVDGLTGRQTRLPLDLGVRLERRRGPLALGGELGVAAAIFHADGLDTAMPQAGTRLDLGGRAGVFLRCQRCSPRAAPFVGLHVLLFPWPYAIAVAPADTLGSTPALWLGATLGVSTAL